MDMRMPVMDGYEATRQIKSTAEGRTTPIIGLSASAFEEQRSAVLAAGCDDFLRKPFQFSDFFDLMRQHIGVRYVYQKDSRGDGAPAERPDRFYLVAESLSKVPDALIKDLHLAVKETNPVKTESAIALIATHHQPLASELSKLATDFRFDVLRDLLEAEK
jgi:CheY-like chemotaxis protein